VYLALLAFERRLSPASLGALSVAITIALFTKYTAFAVLPAVLAGFFSAWRQSLVVPRKKVLLAAAATLALPLIVLAAYLIGNYRTYHHPLPWNVALYDPTVDRPRDDERISFVSFKPWEDLRTPILAPGKLHSFWTLVYSGMWFDTDPRFLPFLDSRGDWWDRYYAWYGGQAAFPNDTPPWSGVTHATGASLIALGVVPLILVLIGCGLCVSGKWK